MVTIEQIRLAVFDLDDTLYPEWQFVEGGFRAVAEALVRNADPQVEPLVRRMMELLAGKRRDIFQTLLAELNLPTDAERVNALVELYRTADRKLSLFDDAERILARFRRAGIRLAVLTDGPPAAQQAKIRLLEIQKHMDRIVYTDEYGPGFGKPCVRCFELLVEEFQVEHSQCVYIADNEAKDFLAPNRLGWRSIKVDRPDAVYKHVAAPSPDHRPQSVVTTLDEIRL